MMPQTSKTLCVIPARGGSKGIPLKNIALLNDRPLVSHTIELANSISEFDAVCLTSDHEMILAECTGRCLPIKRPNTLSKEDSKSEDAAIHSIKYFDKIIFDYVVLLEPTSPFRTKNDVSRGLDLLHTGKWDSIIAVCKANGNYGVLDEGCFMPFQKERRRQDRKTFYQETGVFYGCKVKKLLSSGTLVSENWGALEINEGSALDINNHQDLQEANEIWRNR